VKSSGREKQNIGQSIHDIESPSDRKKVIDDDENLKADWLVCMNNK
jgi:hypothetical protein